MARDPVGKPVRETTLIEPWANNGVVALFGLVIGAMVSLATALDPREHNIPRKPGESVVAWQVRVFRIQDQQLSAAPGAYTATSAIFAGLIAVLVLTILLSPVEMNWWFFLGGLAVGASTFSGIRELGKRGKLTVPEDARAWILPKSRRGGTGTRRTDAES